MPIEYQCVECHRSLRVPDEAAGKQARCPDCGTIQQVPLPPSPFRDAESAWFAPAAKSPPDQPDTAGEVNPYQAPPLSPAAWDRPFRGPLPRHLIESKVQGPAIALIALAVIMLLVLGLSVALQVAARVGGADGGAADLAATSVGFTISGAIYIVMLVGGIRMRQLRNYTLAVTAAVLAVLPCSGCCIVSLPCGIWALVVLLDANVRAAFE